MSPLRPSSPPPRSITPELLHPLPSPVLAKVRRSTNSLRPCASTAQSSYPLSNSVAKLDLAIDEFGLKDSLRPSLKSHDLNTIVFPDVHQPEEQQSSPISFRPRRRRSSAVSTRRPYLSLRNTSPTRSPTRSPTPFRSRSPPPVCHSKSPPPPLPPIPSSVLSAAHKTTDKAGLQHIYIQDMNFGCAIASRKSPSFGCGADHHLIL